MLILSPMHNPLLVQIGDSANDLVDDLVALDGNAFCVFLHDLKSATAEKEEATRTNLGQPVLQVGFPKGQNERHVVGTPQALGDAKQGHNVGVRQRVQQHGLTERVVIPHTILECNVLALLVAIAVAGGRWNLLLLLRSGHDHRVQEERSAPLTCGAAGVLTEARHTQLA
jgi:hypothetical protein